MGHDRRFHADDWWQTFGNDLPGFAFVARSIEFAAPRAEVNAGRIKRVRGHAIAQHGLERVLLRQPTGERLPGGARVARAIDAQLALRRAAVFVPLNGDDVNRIGIVRVSNHAEAKVRRHSVLDVSPGIATIVAAIESPMVLQENLLRLAPLLPNLVPALPNPPAFFTPT